MKNLSDYALPVNATAARVVARGEAYESKKKVLVTESPFPMRTRPPLKNSIDLTGIRQGRLVVVGLSEDKRGVWVCRCDCGVYCHRKAKAIRNPRNHVDRCEECRHLAHLKRNDHYRRTGKNLKILDGMEG